MKLVFNLSIPLAYKTTIFSNLIHAHAFFFDYLNASLFSSSGRVLFFLRRSLFSTFSYGPTRRRY